MSQNLVIGSGNLLLPNRHLTIAEPMITSHHWELWDQAWIPLQLRCKIFQSEHVKKLAASLFRPQWVKSHCNCSNLEIEQNNLTSWIILELWSKQNKTEVTTTVALEFICLFLCKRPKNKRITISSNCGHYPRSTWYNNIQMKQQR